MARELSAAVYDVAKCPQLLTLTTTRVGLLVFGFDSDQRDGATWRPHRKRLEELLGKANVICRGNAKDIRLTGADPAPPVAASEPPPELSLDEENDT